MKRVILLADDSPTIQRLVTQMFVDVDFDIVAVSNGDAAIRKFEELRPAVVLADIYMPGKNGYEVCTYVRKHAERGGTPVILLAGAFDAFDGRVASAAGATAHITKPFEPQALVNLVLSVLSNEAPAAATETVEPVAPAPAPTPAPASSPADTSTPAREVAPAVSAASKEPEDLLGLQELFKPAAPQRSSLSVTEEEIERIADRVIQKLSTQVIEDVAWHVVPDITTKVLREELKRQS